MPTAGCTIHTEAEVYTIGTFAGPAERLFMEGIRWRVGAQNASGDYDYVLDQAGPVLFNYTA